MNYKNYCVLDCETESKTALGRVANPLVRDNYVVMLQAKENNKSSKYIYKKDGIGSNIDINLKQYNIIVGSNIKFDALYLYNYDCFQKFLKNGGLLWDTQTVEYLLSGQNPNLFFNLDSLSKKYGGTQKYDRVKVYYQEGKTTNEIIDLLGFKKYLSYALGDVDNTEIVYKGQVTRAIKTNMMPLILDYLKFYRMIVDMEYNGLYVDKKLLEDKYKKQKELVDKQYDNLIQKAYEYNWPKHLDFDPNSPTQVSVLLFGGTQKVKIDEPIKNESGDIKRFKTGKNKGEIKTRKNIKDIKIKGLQLEKTEETKKEGVYKTSNSALKKLNHDYIDLILNYRKNYKLLTTYYWDGNSKGFIPCINPYTGCIHSDFKTTITRTTRLASRHPNVQNCHPQMLDVFSSRSNFGCIVEMDWSQLEVVCAAWLSQDTVLKMELEKGLDMHRLNACKLFNKDEKEITKEERKLAKFMTFGILYGQGSKGLAESYSIDEKLAEEFINMFYIKYQGISLWHQNLKNEANNNVKFQPKKHSYIVSPTKQKFYLEPYDSGWFPSTQIKNYPVQGLAAYVQLIGINSVSEDLLNNKNKLLLIDMVHDSYLFDSLDKDHEFIRQIKTKMLQSVKEKFKFNLFELDMKTGNSWGELNND